VVVLTGRAERSLRGGTVAGEEVDVHPMWS
jgi:hypothetical protein